MKMKGFFLRTHGFNSFLLPLKKRNKRLPVLGHLTNNRDKMLTKKDTVLVLKGAELK